MANTGFESLLSGYSWNGYGNGVYGRPGNVKYTFNITAGAPPAYYSRLPAAAWRPTGVSALNPQMRSAFEGARLAWGNVADITLTYTDQVSSAEIVVGMSATMPLPTWQGVTFDILGDNLTAPWSGDIWFSSQNTAYSNPAPATLGYWATVHELGHALGLVDGKDAFLLTPEKNNKLYTVMSYNANPHAASWQPTKPMLYDIAAIQFIYGPNLLYNAGNTIHRYASKDVYEAIWDGSGIDTIDASASASNNWINLNPGEGSSIGSGAKDRKNIFVAFINQDSGWIENAIGGPKNDELTGNERANVLEGRGGSDVLIGDPAGKTSADILNGGAAFDNYFAGRGDILIDDPQGQGRVYLADLKNLLVTGGKKVKPGDNEPLMTWIGGGLGFRQAASTLDLVVHNKVAGVWTQWVTVKDYFKSQSYMSAPGERYSYLGIVLTDTNDFGNAPAPDMKRAAEASSPIVLDLDGDGVETVGLAAGTHFDHDGNLRAELTGWAGADDGLLAYDRNGDGAINNATELFGNATPLAAGGIAANGFLALASYDKNADRQITAGDSIYSSLRLWRDANLNGESEAWELSTLADLKITSIATGWTDSALVDAAGNAHRQVGRFTVNGQSRTATDVWFTQDKARTVELDQRPLAADVEALPQAKGFGEVHDLRVAMASNATLKGLVKQFVATTDGNARDALLAPMLLQWAGSANVDPTNRGDIDGRYLDAVEKFAGERFLSPGGAVKPDPGSVDIIMREFGKLKNFLRSQLLAQSHYRTEFDLIKVKFDDTKGAFVTDISAFKANLNALYTANNTAKITDLYRTLRGFDTFEGFMPSMFESIIADAQLTRFAVLPESIVGTAGADSLSGNQWDNDFHGKGGNDYMYGGEGDDIFRFGIGDGADRIMDPSGTDKLVLMSGITPDRVRVMYGNPGLLLRLVDAQGRPTGDEVNWYGWADSNDAGIEAVYFADGTVWTEADIRKRILLGTEQADSIWGYESDDLITGQAGADYLHGFGGNDRIEGGSDNDHLDGGLGADSLDGGDGDDRLYGGAGNDTLNGGNNDDTLRGDVGNDTVNGGNGNDFLYGDDGNDVLSGGAGNETLDGGAGSDTYLFSRGAGQDRIVQNDAGSGKIDLIRFDAGILPTDVVASMDGAALKLSVRGTADAITVDNYFDGGTTNNPYKVEEIRFANGTVWTTATVRQIVLTGTGADDGIFGFNGGSNTIDGGGGADTLFGGDMNDTLLGGIGNDQLYGREGNDTLSGGAGDDILDGMEGNDTYRFGRGGGQDRVDQWDWSGEEADAILFDANVAPSDVTASRDGESLKLSIIGTTDSISVSGQFADGYDPNPYLIEQVKFANGTVWNSATLRQKALDGSTGNDIIYGFSTNDVINGGSGNDRLYGREGRDSLNGGPGNDWLYGDSGSDTYVFGRGSGQDVINLADYWARQSDPTSSDTLLFGSGVLAADLLFAGNGIAIKGTTDQVLIENYWYGELGALRFADGLTFGYGDLWLGGTYPGYPANAGESDSIMFGGDANDILNGLGGNDLINGAAGADTMRGGVGSDLYVVDHAGDVVAENANEGADTVQSFISYTLGANVENLTLAGSAAINGTGNALNNVLTGNAAGNVLNGAAGADTLRGGAGNDTYVVEHTGDLVGENANEGADSVQSSVTYTLAANVENLTLTGSLAISGTGNTLNNVITGNAANNMLTGAAGNDTLNGGAGADTMLGGLGNDTYVVENAGDIVTENANGGTDRVTSYLTYTLGAELEELQLLGGGAINGTGNALSNAMWGNGAVNTLTGGAGSDWLDGSGGADTMIGGVGDDGYFVDNAGDAIVENAGEGVETVYTSMSSHTLGANVENLLLYTTSALNGNGNALNNVLTGNAVNNVLNGGAGNDLLNGGTGAGSDTLAGDAGNDVLEGMDGNDMLSDSAGNNLFNGGVGADTLTGNSGREFFIGGAGNDTISTGTGADIIAFNRGSGQDVVTASAGADNTLSLGGGIRYADMSFSKTGTDLVLNLGGSADKITLSNWYGAGTTNKSVLNMQVIVEAMAGFSATSTDKLVNKKVANFDFLGLANAFDAAGAPVNWALTNSLLTKHLSGSDTAALGGDLAYRYGRTGSLANMGFDPVQGVLSNGSFGTAAQALQSSAVLDAGLKRLS